ncbi:MAG TPA: phosphoribosylaminoimidazolesuccinocarboxamide synthase [Steroidobacteraceae bacterium]|nr:phosphoribosylaminoimidazolesuccinocarboxamide synthase [Steroidobacteraceae bacterium]
MPTPTVYRTALNGLEKIHEGKVRDIYAVGDDALLIVTTDRLSAFDVVLPDPIPNKGRVLHQISDFWFGRTQHIVPNHLTQRPLSSVVKDPAELTMLEGRAAIVRKLKALPIEAVVRGYLIGSGWKDYQKTGKVCGIALPSGLRQAEQLARPLFTPAFKAAAGQHDENITFEEVERLVGPALAAGVRDTAIALYNFAAQHALDRGIIIADTKFEFGRDRSGRVTLIDEVLTPDSSRFWPAESYEPGHGQPSFDKQPLRDYLDAERRAGRWNGEAPPPTLPPDVVHATSERYLDAFGRITGAPLDLTELT